MVPSLRRQATVTGTRRLKKRNYVTAGLFLGFVEAQFQLLASDVHEYHPGKKSH